MRTPKRLFKYECISDIGKSNLENRFIFFRSPLNFNDPFDCHIGIHHLYPTEIEYQNLFTAFSEIYSNDPDFTFTDHKDESFRYLSVTQINERFKKMVSDGKKQLSVTCFSETQLNLLMWSHYADKHKGVCIEFDGENDFFKRATKVRYTNRLELFNSYDVTNNRIIINIKNALNAKHKAWRYEKEWRIIRSLPEGTEQYPMNSIKSLYLGMNSELNDSIVVSKIIKKSNPNLRIYKCLYNYKSYALRFEEMTLDELENFSS